MRETFIDLVDEELDTRPLVHSSGRIRRKNAREHEDEIYKEGTVTNKKRTKLASREPYLIPNTDEDASKPFDSVPEKFSKKARLPPLFTVKTTAQAA